MAIHDLAPRLQAFTAPQLQALLLRVASDPAARPVVERALAASERLPTAPAREGFKPLLKTRSSAADGKPDAIIIVDPLSTGARLADLAARRGFLIVRVMSQAFPAELMAILPAGCAALDWHATIEYDAAEPANTVAALRALDCHLLGVLVGCESGVECHDALTTAFGGFPSNGLEKSLARRDKHPMGEAVRAAGLRAVKQRLCGSWAEARAYCASLGVSDQGDSAWCVLKPCKSAGTDGVFIAKSLAESEQRFGDIVGHENVFGETNAAVLVQEFMKGTEFVVDSVSVEGVHKCVAIWVYDKRPCNGAQFVYYAMDLYQSPDGAREQALVEYVHGCLDALGVRHGPSHAEVMWLDRDQEPCLVEVGCRPHGGEGTFVDMAEPRIGYSQLSVMLDAVEKPYRFHRLPKRPARFAGGARECCLVAHAAGVLTAFPGLHLVRALPSYVCEELKAKIGEELPLTVDFLTTPGSIMLMHEVKEQVERDTKTIHALCEKGLYDVAPKSRIRLRSF